MVKKVNLELQKNALNKSWKQHPPPSKKNSSCVATYFLSDNPFKQDKEDMRVTAGKAKNS